jgi:hypothetical protein
MTRWIANPARLTPDDRIGQGLDCGRAWAIAVAAFFASSVVFGVIYSFGVFLKPMAADFHADTGAASAFFSITSMCFYLLGVPAGRLADAARGRRGGCGDPRHRSLLDRSR